MHQQMQRGAQELNAIRSEWQTLTRPTNLATLLLAPEAQPLYADGALSNAVANSSDLLASFGAVGLLSL
jgi:hypothetical protein